MTEEIQKEEGQTKQNVPDPVVEEASAQGWVPKEEFQGEEHKWVDAGEFLRRGELFKKIEQISKIAKQSDKTLQEFKAHYAKVKETEYQRALDTLKAERKVALVDGDFEKVENIETRIDTVKAEALAVKTGAMSQPQQEIYPEVAAWVDKNKWYNTDLPMKAYADTVAAQLNKQGINGPALLKGIDEEIRKAFPTKFNNPNRERAGAVESSTSKGTSRGRESYNLSEQETRIMNTFVRDGVMTKEQYISDLKRVKGGK